MSEAASSTMGLTVQPSEASAPIAHLVPYLKYAFKGFQSLFSLIISILRPLLVLSPIPILLYVFAPLLVFLDVAMNTFIWLPYRFAAYLLDGLYPLYVFCGVACITGSILGLTARIMCRFIVNSVRYEEEPSDTMQRVDVKGKGRKVERVKFES